MSEQAKIGDTHVKMGLVCGGDGTVIGPLLMEPHRAKELLMDSNKSLASWFTFPFITGGFMALCVWCVNQQYNPDLWLPSLSVGHFFVMVAFEQILPRNPEHNLFKDDKTVNDILYNIMTGALRPLISSVVILLVVWLNQFTFSETLQVLWPSDSSFGLQVFLGIMILTFADYWTHRAFHTYDKLWWFHVIHHTSDKMHVFKGGRLHFVDEVAHTLAATLPLLLIGAPAEVMLLSGAWAVCAGGIVHANIAQSFPSWAHYFLPTVQMHNLHHSVERKYQDSNYSGDSPFWDWVFGTLSHPDICELGDLGIKEDYVPQSFFQQLWYPFKAIKHPPVNGSRFEHV